MSEKVGNLSNQDFSDRISRIGPPKRTAPLNQYQISDILCCLPESLLDFFCLYGIGDYFNRRVQYCYPLEFSPVLALIFGKDDEFSPEDCFVVGYSAFGRLLCWSQRQDVFFIDLVDLRLTSRKLAPAVFGNMDGLPARERSGDPNLLARSLLPFEPEDYEEFDANGQPMFERCVAMHGPLERGECYGYFPAIATVGLDSPMRRVENIRRIPALEHFAILAQLGTFHLMRLERGRYTSVRPIGYRAVPRGRPHRTHTTCTIIVRASGIPIQRHTDICTPNNGNCPGEYIYAQSTEVIPAPDGGMNKTKPGMSVPGTGQATDCRRPAKQSPSSTKTTAAS